MLCITLLASLKLSLELAYFLRERAHSAIGSGQLHTQVIDGGILKNNLLVARDFRGLLLGPRTADEHAEREDSHKEKKSVKSHTGITSV